MKHIDEIRITELSLDTELVPDKSEAAHLRECSRCADALKKEKSFTASLCAIPAEPIPGGFVARVQAEFVRANSMRKGLTPSLLIGFSVASLLASAMLWLIITNPAGFTCSAAMGFAKLATLIEAAFLVFDRVPLATEAVTSSSLAMVLLSVFLLSLMSKKTVLAKEGLLQEGLQQEGLQQEGLQQEGLHQEGQEKEGLQQEGLEKEGRVK